MPGTGPADPVTPNPQIFPRYANVPDPKFFPEFPNGVKVPQQGGFQPAPTLAQLDLLRKAAVTTLLADKLLDFSHRTGQTLFVVDGQIINTAGYRRSYESPRPTPPGPGAAADRLSESARSAALPARSPGLTVPAVASLARNNVAGRQVPPSGASVPARTRHAPGPRHRWLKCVGPYVIDNGGRLEASCHRRGGMRMRSLLVVLTLLIGGSGCSAVADPETAVAPACRRTLGPGRSEGDARTDAPDGR